MTDDVSRETPPVPATARGVFAADRLALAESYAGLLATDGVVRGLIGPRESPRLWERHLLNCALLQEVVPVGASVCDVGSGAGLPGIVLAIARPDLSVTLVEPLLRRTTFLEEVTAALDLGVEVVRGRAADLHGERCFDVVTSRAVAPLGRLLEWCMPLVAADGALVALKGASVSDEVEDARGVLQRYSCGEPEVLELGAGSGLPPTMAVRVAWSDPASVGWPLPRPPAAGRRPTRRDARASGRPGSRKGGPRDGR